MSEMLNMLQNAIAGRSPIVYVFSPEEERILRGIREIAAKDGISFMGPPTPTPISQEAL